MLACPCLTVPALHWFVLPAALESGPYPSTTLSLRIWMPIPFTVESIVIESVVDLFPGVVASVSVT
ncbi:hypothetical protein D3C72_2027980 [compost metagenome]